MELKDVQIGMKVSLLGKHVYEDSYDNIEDWYNAFYNNERVQKIKEQGYGVVVGIESEATEMSIIINNELDEYKRGWYFSPSDLELFKDKVNESDRTKSPKEWLLTPMAVCTARSGDKFVTLSNERSPIFEYEGNWSRNLESEYDENLFYVFDYGNSESSSDIVKIEYNGQVVWERKEEKYYTFLEAIRTGRKIKFKNWQNFLEAQEVLNWTYVQQKEFVIEIINEKVWQVEE